MFGVSLAKRVRGEAMFGVSRVEQTRAIWSNARGHVTDFSINYVFKLIAWI